jgi:hypothetical protein
MFGIKIKLRNAVFRSAWKLGLVGKAVMLISAQNVGSFTSGAIRRNFAGSIKHVNLITELYYITGGPARHQKVKPKTWRILRHFHDNTYFIFMVTATDQQRS